MGDFRVTQEYREDLGDQDENGYYDYAYRYWDYTFEIGGRVYVARVYTHTPDKAGIRSPIPGQPRAGDDDLQAMASHLRREAGVTSIETLEKGGYEPWPQEPRSPR